LFVCSQTRPIELNFGGKIYLDLGKALWLKYFQYLLYALPPIHRKTSLHCSHVLDINYLAGEPQRAETLRDDSPWDKEAFRLKNSWLVNSMYTSEPSGQFYSLQYESSTYLEGWYGLGRFISDKMSYKTTTCVVAKPLVIINIISSQLSIMRNPSALMHSQECHSYLYLKETSYAEYLTLQLFIIHVMIYVMSISFISHRF